MKNLICNVFGHEQREPREFEGGYMSATRDWDKNNCKRCGESLWTDDDFKAFGGIKKFWELNQERRDYQESNIMKHLYTAQNYKYEKLEDGKFIPVQSNSELLAGTTVKVFDADTGKQLTAERGEITFTLTQDYDGIHRIPFFA